MFSSLVITVLDEEKSIETLLQALNEQTKKPDELVFIDGGSSDSTVRLIRRWAKGKENIKVLIKKGSSIARGRNIGIKNSKGGVIIHTDAGCLPHKRWLQRITAPFKNSGVDIVSGYYKMTGESPFQECLAPYLGIPPERLNQKTFLPSARSMAFRKKIWERVGGFSEKLSKAGEDTLFNYSAKKLGARFSFQPSAVVNWELPSNLWSAIKKFYFYAKGDAQTRIWWHAQQGLFTHRLKIFSIYLRYLVGLISISWVIKRKSFFWFPLLLFISYLAWSVRKNYTLLKSWRALFWLPVIQIASDFAVMAGFMVGSLPGIKEKNLD